MGRWTVLVFVVVLAACGKETTVTPTPQPPPPTSPTPASYTVTGSVTDANRMPILGAVVSVIDPPPNPNALKSATTDFAGRYTLSGLKFAGFSLAVSSPGYIGSSRGISLTTDAATATADFVLSPLPGVSFDGLRTNTNGSAFGTYTEAGFTVSPTVGDWIVITTYGRPAPFVEFFTPFGPNTSSEISVTANGRAFTFRSVDLYSSVTPTPYEISGFLNGTLVFRLAATQGNTFGNFATVPNPSSDARIDTLFVRLSNPVTRNPMGLDNIRVAF
jgi:hypothetical protein